MREQGADGNAVVFDYRGGLELSGDDAVRHSPTPVWTLHVKGDGQPVVLSCKKTLEGGKAARGNRGEGVIRWG